MQIRVQQINPTIGNIDGNHILIRTALKDAERAGMDLLVLPEMVLTGYPVQDLLEKEAFREYCYKMNETIIRESGETAILFGSITENNLYPGRKMFNSAILARRGESLGQVNKTLLPTYDVFDDLRYFEPNRTISCLELQGHKLGVTICEDIWYNENEVQYHHYEINPADKLREQGARIIINVSASPFTKTKQANRLEMLRNHASSLELPLLYCNQVGAQTDIVFDGDSHALDQSGEVVAASALFRPDYFDVAWEPETGAIRLMSAPPQRTEDKNAAIFEAVKIGLNDFLEKTGLSRDVVLGLSGGIDSAVVAALAAAALGGEHVTALTMPGEFSSRGSVEDSVTLADNLGITLHNTGISTLYNEFMASLKPLFGNLPFGVAEENLQSRIRGTFLMAWSNKHRAMLLPTGNKSELSVGYSTLYGDMNGGLNLIGDLYKTEVYELARWLNESFFKKEIIPESTLEKPPSAELRPDQKDTDSLPAYEVLDEILLRYIELQQTSNEIIDTGFSEEVVRRTIRMVDRNEFKRFQGPPILKLSSKAFGNGRRWPMVQGWTGHEFR